MVVAKSSLVEAEVIQIDRIDVTGCDEWASDLDLELHRGLELHCFELSANIAEAIGIQRFRTCTFAGESITEFQFTDWRCWLPLYLDWSSC